jgi:hypothetical protein
MAKNSSIKNNNSNYEHIEPHSITNTPDIPETSSFTSSTTFFTDTPVDTIANGECIPFQTQLINTGLDVIKSEYYDTDFILVHPGIYQVFVRINVEPNTFPMQIVLLLTNAIHDIVEQIWGSLTLIPASGGIMTSMCIFKNENAYSMLRVQNISSISFCISDRNDSQLIITRLG